MGRLNIASWALLIGSLGQLSFLAPLFPNLPYWVVWIPLLPPWLTIYTISFCRQSPFGARPFRYALMLAMGWYAGFTLLGELLVFLTHPAPWGDFSFTLGRLFMYPGALSFIVFLRFCVALRRHECGVHN